MSKGKHSDFPIHNVLEIQVTCGRATAGAEVTLIQGSDEIGNLPSGCDVTGGAGTRRGVSEAQD